MIIECVMRTKDDVKLELTKTDYLLEALVKWLRDLRKSSSDSLTYKILGTFMKLPVRCPSFRFLFVCAPLDISRRFSRVSVRSFENESSTKGR